MSRRPKDIGTAAETSRPPLPRRRRMARLRTPRLAGNRDTGDLTVCRRPLIVAE